MSTFLGWLKAKRHRVICLGLGFFLAVILSLFFAGGFFSSAQLRFSDKLFVPKPVSPEILIVAIDDASIQAIGRWPWDRKIHAQFLNRLVDNKPRVIGLDVAFPESSASDDILAQAMGKLASSFCRRRPC